MVVFMDLMDHVSREFLDKFIIIFIDVILIYYLNYETHDTSEDGLRDIMFTSVVCKVF